MPTSLATAAPSIHPGPPQGRTAGGTDRPSRSGRLLGLIRKLIDFGKELVGTLQNTPSAAQVFDITRRFGTLNIALIIARITLGLRLAAGLEHRVASNAASLDKNPVPAPASPPPGRSRRAQPAVRTPAPRDDDSSLLNHLPSAEEIAAQVRRRSIGAVLADICNDLGILPCDPLWNELHTAVDSNRGNFLQVMKGMLRRMSIKAFVPMDTPVVPLMREGAPPGCSPLAEPATRPP